MSSTTEKTIEEMTTDEKLTLIADCIQHMNRRDRWRAVGNIIRTTVILIPLLIALGSIWYLYDNAQALLQQSVERVTEQIGSEQLIEQIQSLMQKK